MARGEGRRCAAVVAAAGGREEEAGTAGRELWGAPGSERLRAGAGRRGPSRGSRACEGGR